MNQSAQAFYAAREFLLSPPRGLRHGLPRLPLARDHGVQLGARPLRRGRRPSGATSARCGSSSRTASEAHWTFAELSARSNQVANWLREQGVARGDRMILMLGNQVELWETLLAAMKLGAVVIPATTLLTAADLRDRLDRGNAKHVVVGGADAGKFDDVEGDYTKIAVRDAARGLARLRRRRRRSRRRSRPTASRTAPTPCCSTSPPAPPRSPSSSSTRTRPTRSGTCPRCTGSGWSRATSTSTSPRRAGRSTRGATSSRRGSPRRACSS